MTERDFELVASIIKGLDEGRMTRQQVAFAFGQRLVESNPRFNKVRFVKACLEDPSPAPIPAREGEF